MLINQYHQMLLWMTRLDHIYATVLGNRLSVDVEKQKQTFSRLCQ